MSKTNLNVYSPLGEQYNLTIQTSKGKITLPWFYIKDQSNL